MAVASGRSAWKHSRHCVPIQRPWKLVTRSCHKLDSAGELPGLGRVAFRASPRRSGCWAPWRRAGGGCGRGTAWSSAPCLAAQTQHGKLLRANVAGTTESPGLPSAGILGCASYSHMHGSLETPVYTRPLHISVFFQH